MGRWYMVGRWMDDFWLPVSVSWSHGQLTHIEPDPCVVLGIPPTAILEPWLSTLSSLLSSSADHMVTGGKLYKLIYTFTQIYDAKVENIDQIGEGRVYWTGGTCCGLVSPVFYLLYPCLQRCSTVTYEDFRIHHRPWIKDRASQR